MDVMMVVTGVVVLGLVYALWIWWKDGKTCQPFCRRMRQRIRSVLGVVSQEEMSVLQEHVRRKEQQWENRVSKLETATKFSNQLQYVSKEIERRLTQLQDFLATATGVRPDVSARRAAGDHRVGKRRQVDWCLDDGAIPVGDR